MTISTAYTGTMPLEELTELLQLLAFIKRRSIAFLQEWESSSQVTELREGLCQQLPHERRHLALILERLRALGMKVDESYGDTHLAEAFQIISSASQETEKLAGFYRGIKEYIVARCGNMIALADPDTRQTMDEISDDEGRVQRWGETLRLKLSPTPELQRDGNFMRARIMEHTAKSRERLAIQLQQRARRALQDMGNET